MKLLAIAILAAALLGAAAGAAQSGAPHAAPQAVRGADAVPYVLAHAPHSSLHVPSRCVRVILHGADRTTVVSNGCLREHAPHVHPPQRCRILIHGDGAWRSLWSYGCMSAAGYHVH